MHVREAAFEAIVVEGEALVIEAHQVEDGGVEIIDGGLVQRGFETELVALAVTKALLHTGSGEEAGEGAGVVIATGAALLMIAGEFDLSISIVAAAGA